MTSTEMSSCESWVTAAVKRRWPGASASEIKPLKGDASSRRFWRVTLDRAKRDEVPPTAIAIDLGPDDLPLYARALDLLPGPLPEPPWLNLHRFLQKIGAATPNLYEADAVARMLLVEDVGELALFDAATRGDAGDLYRLAANELLLFHIEGSRQLDSQCLASRVAYNGRLFRWELEQFAEYGIDAVAPNVRRSAIAPELDDLAARLEALPRVFSHRDYHGHNLYVQAPPNDRGEPRLRVIDFQDALMAPAAQDLSVLLTTRDVSRIITPAIESRVLNYYYAALIRRQAAPMSFDAFMESYRLCVLQHALKMIGRFIYIEREGKSGYIQYIPFIQAQARRMLASERGFPNLRAALGA